MSYPLEITEAFKGAGLAVETSSHIHQLLDAEHGNASSPATIDTGEIQQQITPNYYLETNQIYAT